METALYVKGMRAEVALIVDHFLTQQLSVRLPFVSPQRIAGTKDSRESDDPAVSIEAHSRHQMSWDGSAKISEPKLDTVDLENFHIQEYLLSALIDNRYFEVAIVVCDRVEPGAWLYCLTFRQSRRVIPYQPNKFRVFDLR